MRYPPHVMRTGILNTCWWAALAAGVGGTVLFFTLVAVEGWPSENEWGIWLWPPATVALTALAWWRLRRLYRAEPFQGLGLWQLSLVDLLVASFFTGLLLASAQAEWPDEFVPWGAAACVTAGLLFVAGQLVAARRGMEKLYPRILFASGFALTVFGALGTGSLIVLLIAAAFYGGLGKILGDLLGLSTRQTLHWLMILFRAALGCLAAGPFLCKAASWGPMTGRREGKAQTGAGAGK